MKHIGIVAITAEGAALMYRTICSEGQARLGPLTHPEISLHNLSSSDYQPYIESGRWDEVGELMLGSAERLTSIGAEILLCGANVTHQALDLIRERSSTPWLHIAEEVVAVATARGYSKLGILGTRPLMEGPVYPGRVEAAGMECVIPEEADRAAIHARIFDELVKGVFTDSTRAWFQDQIAKLGECGCDAVVLACTEIPLLMTEDESPLPALDSTRILARAALDHAIRD